MGVQEHYFTKSELILIHKTLWHVKRFFEEAGVSNSYFSEYEKLEILPTDIYEDKSEHKRAIKILTRGISAILSHCLSENDK